MIPVLRVQPDRGLKPLLDYLETLFEGSVRVISSFKPLLWARLASEPYLKIRLLINRNRFITLGYFMKELLLVLSVPVAIPLILTEARFAPPGQSDLRDQI